MSEQCHYGQNHPIPNCGARSTDIGAGFGWTCTLAPGHRGNHIACSTNMHNLYIWHRTLLGRSVQRRLKKVLSRYTHS